MQLAKDLRAMVEDVIKCWSNLEELASFGMARHGYGQTDVGYGVTYKEDLDPGDALLPEGCVEIYGGFGKEFEVVIPETTYLDILADVLRRNGLDEATDGVATTSAKLAAGGSAVSRAISVMPWLSGWAGSTPKCAVPSICSYGPASS